MTLRSGITTGACAAAAAKAAAIVLDGLLPPQHVSLHLPNDRTIEVPILYAEHLSEESAMAAVRKDAGDDPDVTNGAEVVVTLRCIEGDQITFSAGEGIGTVTKPGLQIPPGEPAVNPVPRAMIVKAVREITPVGVNVEISIPGGRKLAAKTFNPRLGIVGGLSILGTTGIVRPYCMKAQHEAIRCAFNVAAASGNLDLVLSPGAIGARAALTQLGLKPDELVEIGNEWGFAADSMRQYDWRSVRLVGHPGKLAKLAAGQWNTHSSRSEIAARFVAKLARTVLDQPVADSTTTEGIFESLGPADRKKVGDELARRIAVAFASRAGISVPVGVLLVNMAGRKISELVFATVQPLTIVGCGPGAPELVSDAARTAIQQAEVLVGSRRLFDLFDNPTAERVEVTAKIDEALEKTEVARAAGRNVVVLVSGDPGVCSLADAVVRRFGRAACRIVPGISSVQVAFARLGHGWLDAKIVSAHGRQPTETAEELSKLPKIAVLGGGRDATAWAANLADALDGSHALFVCENLTLPGERIAEISPCQLRESEPASLVIFVWIKRSLL